MGAKRRQESKADRQRKAIARDAAAADERLKRLPLVRAQPRKKPTRTFQGGKPNALQVARNLLSTRDKQEMLWLATLADPWSRIKTRIPVTVVTGLVPCDLHTVEGRSMATANSNGIALAMMQPDSWFGDFFLNIDGATGNPAFYTDGSYVSSAFPAAGAVPGTGGLQASTLPDVDSNITNNVNTGTEFGLVSGGLSIECFLSGNADGSWSGQLTAVRTLDPERFPITGMTYGALMAAAALQGSSYYVEEYRITADGNFVRKELAIADAVSGAVTNANSVGQVGLSMIPRTVAAFEWHRVYGTPTANVSKPTIGFILRAPAGSTFSISYISNYMLERYPSTKVTSPMGIQGGVSDAGSLLGAADHLHKPMPTLNPASRPSSSGAHGLGSGVGSWIKNQAQNNPTALAQLAQAGASVWRYFFGDKAASTLANGVSQVAGGALDYVENTTIPIIEEIIETEAVPFLENAAPLMIGL